MIWVVSYDIPDDKRRRKVSDVLEGFGRRVQGSVFECEIDEAKCNQLERRLVKEIEPSEDDIRFYPMNEADLKRVRMFGKASLTRTAFYTIIEQNRPF